MPVTVAARLAPGTPMVTVAPLSTPPVRVTPVCFSDTMIRSSPVTLAKLTPGPPVMTVSVTAAESALTLPAPSVARTWKAWAPSDRAVAGVKLQAPLASAVVSPRRRVPSKTSKRAPAAAVPASAGVASAVTPPAPTPPAMVIAGVSAVVWMVRAKAADGMSLPAATAVTVCAPAARSDAKVNCHSPSASAVAVPMAVVSPSRWTLTTEPGSAVPRRGGRRALVTPSSGRPVSSAIPTMTGLAAGAPRTVTASVAEGWLALPSASTATATSAPAPTGRWRSQSPSATLQAPEPFATTEASSAALFASYRRTVLPAAAVPVTVGRSLDTVPLVASVSARAVGAAGTAVFTVRVRDSEATVVPFAAVTVRMADPCGNRASVAASSVTDQLCPPDAGISVAVRVWVAPSLSVKDRVTAVAPTPAVPVTTRPLATVAAVSVPPATSFMATEGAMAATTTEAEAVLTLLLASLARKASAVPSPTGCVAVRMSKNQAPFPSARTLPTSVAPA